MIIIRMTGGLGNQMFQYALYLKLTSMGKNVKFDDFTEYRLSNARPIQLWAFGLEYPRASQKEIDKITDGFIDLFHKVKRKICGRKSLEYQEETCNFDPVILQKETAYLTGYFQSEKYFEDIKDKVREAFAFAPAIYKKLDKHLMAEIDCYRKQIEETLSVSIHIRRGDYLENNEVYGEICTQEYYDKAISLMKDETITPVFYVFSNEDDWAETWCRKQEEKHRCKFVAVKGVPEEIGYLDMELMSQCKHHIIANSSFSWWGAWLNANDEKRVIAPAKWYNHQECHDIYTGNMKRVTAEGELI